MLYYKEGDYHVYTVATGQTRNITKGMPVSFVDVEDDHPRDRPAVEVSGTGWTRDATAVLLSDRWDMWRVPVDGGRPINLTRNGRKDGVRWTTQVSMAGGGGG